MATAMIFTDCTDFKKVADRTAYLEEQAIAHLHDVGLVYCSDSFPVVQVGVAKSILCCPS